MELLDAQNIVNGKISELTEQAKELRRQASELEELAEAMSECSK